MQDDSDQCKRLVYWGQYGPTCWFNSLLMATLYSQQSRKLLLRHINDLDDKIKIYKIFKHILKYKYIRSKKPQKDIKFFEDIKPEKVLQMLNQYNSKKFMVSDFTRGFSTFIYIKRFYKLFNVNALMLLRRKNNVIYDPANNIDSATINKITYKLKSKFYAFQKLLSTPEVLLIRTMDNDTSGNYSNYVLSNSENIRNIRSNDDTIKYNNAEYQLDSVILTNWNITDDNHSICGITCNGQRYVYNGWTLQTKDTAMKTKIKNRRLPCELMKFDWNVKEDQEFCLNPRQCKLDLIYDKIPDDLCFSFAKGERLLVYIKKTDNIGYSSHQSLGMKTPEYRSLNSRPLKDCAEGKIRDPVTKRCVSIQTAAKRNLVPNMPGIISKTKECAEGKVRDPVTKRCISLKTAAKRNLIKSPKMSPISPKVHPKLSIKPCKNPTKTRDPNTGRCVSAKTAAKRKLL